MDAIYLARDNAFDLETWCGTPYWMARAFESAGFRLDYVCPLERRFQYYYKLKRKVLRLAGWDHANDAEWPLLKSYGRQATRLIRGKSAKVILSCGKPHLVFLNTQLPILFFDDASVPSIITTHKGFKKLFPPVKKRWHEAERRVLRKCLYACYSSHWAAEAALKTYGVEYEKKIKVIPFGANAEVRRSPADVELIIKKRDRDTCKLLFVGRVWEDKGGPIAIAAAEELQRQGVKVSMDIVGCRPPCPVPDFVHIHGFVSKKSVEGQSLLDQLYRQSHFLILPTRYEAYGLAFVEASSYGLPSLGTAVGGGPTIVHPGLNGQLFALEAPPERYADYIQDLLNRPDDYDCLCRSSFSEYRSRLNWPRFAEEVLNLIAPLENKASSYVG